MERRGIGPCFICDKMGHLASRCRLKLQAASLVNNSCESRSLPNQNTQSLQDETSVAPVVDSALSNSCPTCSHAMLGAHNSSNETGGLLLTSSSTNKVESSSVLNDRIQAIPLMCAACQRHWRNQLPVVDGRIGSHMVTVLRDTGCSGVVVKKSLVAPDQFTGNCRRCILIDGTVRQFPTALVQISCSLFVGTTEALCMETPVFDVIIGNIENVHSVSDPHPDWKEIESVVVDVNSSGESHSNGKNVEVQSVDGTNVGMAVQTRSQSRDSQRPQRPLKVPSQIPDVSPQEIKQETAKDPTLKKARELAEVSLSDDDRKDSYFMN